MQRIVDNAVKIAMGAGFTGICVLVRRWRKKQRAIEDGMRAVLKGLIIQAYNDATKKGYATIYDRESFTDMVKQYKALKGNGVVPDLEKKFFELRTDPPQI